MSAYIGSVLNLIPSPKHFHYEESYWYCLIEAPKDAQKVGIHWRNLDEGYNHLVGKESWGEINKVEADKKMDLNEEMKKNIEYTAELAEKYPDCDDFVNPEIVSQYLLKNFKITNNTWTIVVPMHEPQKCTHCRNGPTHRSGLFGEPQGAGVEFALYHVTSKGDKIWYGKPENNLCFFWNEVTNLFNNFDVEQKHSVETEYFKECNCRR